MRNVEYPLSSVGRVTTAHRCFFQTPQQMFCALFEVALPASLISNIFEQPV